MTDKPSMVTDVTVIKRVNIESYHRMVNNINAGVCVNFSLNDSFTLKRINQTMLPSHLPISGAIRCKLGPKEVEKENVFQSKRQEILFH